MYNTPIYPSYGMSPQQRMEQLVQQNPQYFSPNVQQAMAPQSTGLKITLVSNIEEANATPADLLGNPTFFYNKSLKEIYMKQIDSTGAAPLLIFGIKPQQQVKLPKEQTQPVIDFQADLKKLSNKVDDIYKLLTPQPTVKAAKNDK